MESVPIGARSQHQQKTRGFDTALFYKQIKYLIHVKYESDCRSFLKDVTALSETADLGNHAATYLPVCLTGHLLRLCQYATIVRLGFDYFFLFKARFLATLYPSQNLVIGFYLT